MSAIENPQTHDVVTLDTSVAECPRLVIEIPPEQEKAVRDILARLSHAEAGISAQLIVLEALRIAAEQTYFWTPEWQARERAADQAIVEGRVATFDTMEDMLDFRP